MLNKSLNLKQVNILVQSVRYRKVDLKRLQPPHYEAQRVLKVTEIKKSKPFDFNFPSYLKCRKKLMELEKQSVEEYPYERILANELKDVIFKSSMILVIHQNPSSGEEYHGSKRKFLKEGIEFIEHGKSTVVMALENSKFISLLELYCDRTFLLCSPEMKLDVAFKLLKRMPYFILLAGVVEDKFLHRNKLEEYSRLPSLDIMRAQFSNTLMGAVTQFSQYITQPQIIVTTQLSQYIELQSEQDRKDASNEKEKT